MLKLVLDNIPTRVFWKDRDLNYLGCNRVFARDAGLKEPDEIVGRNDYELSWSAQADLYRNDDWQVINSGRSKLNYEEPQTNRKGRQFWLKTNKIPLRDIENEIIGVLGTYEEITEQKNTESNLRESEARTRAILDAIPDCMFQISRDGIFLEYSAAQSDLYTTPEQFLGRHIDEVLPPDLAQMTAINIKKTLDTGQMQIFEYSLPINGNLRQYEARMVVCGQTSVLIIGRDVTQRRKAEEALRESLQTSADIVASIPSGLFIYRYEEPDRLILTGSNPEAELLTGIKLSEWEGQEFNNIWPQAKSEGLTEKFLAVVQTGQTFSTESLHYEDNRVRGSFRVRAFSLEGKKLGVAFENITERTRAYEILRESEERYRFMHKNIPAMLHSSDAEDKLTNISNNWLETLGYSRDEVIGRKFTAFLTSDSRQYAEEEVLSKFRETGIMSNVPLSLKKRDGGVIDVLLSQVADRDSTGKIKSSLAVVTDLTDIKLAEEKISKLHRLLAQSPSSVMIIEPNGTVSYVNNRFCEISGYAKEEIIGNSPVILSCKSDDLHFEDNIWKVILSGSPWTGNLQHQHKNGRQYWERISVTPIHDDSGKIVEFLVIGEDITAEIRLQQQMAESDKLSAIGLLAAGVAHGFKNYLCGIMGNASLMLENRYGEYSAEEINDAFSVILDITEKADELATSLLAYSKVSSLNFRPENLTNIIDSTIKLIEREIKKQNINILTYF
jgi:PAS domain S-box-containing protein